LNIPSGKLWWTHAEDGSLASVLAVGPGPPPLQKSVWLHFLALPSERPGGWAMVNYPLLGPLNGISDGPEYEEGAEARWQFAEAGSSGAYTGMRAAAQPSAWISAATRLFASRLGEPIVASDPGHISAAVFREVRADDGARLFEIAPAIIERGMVVSALMPLDVILRDSNGHSFPADWTQVELAETESQVDLGVGPVCRLPGVAMRWPGPAFPAALRCAIPARLKAPFKPSGGENLAVSLSLGHDRPARS